MENKDNNKFNAADTEHYKLTKDLKDLISDVGIIA